MKNEREYRASDEEVIRLLTERPMIHLVTVDEAGWPRVGLHVFVHDGLAVEVHLPHEDPQLGDIRRTGRATIQVDDILVFSPSHWVDETNAAHADHYFRTASLSGEPELLNSRDAIVAHLQTLLHRFQPEGKYIGMEENMAMYEALVDRLTVVRLRPTAISTKFKLGQKAPASVQSRIIRQLRLRDSELDRATIAAMERHGSGSALATPGLPEADRPSER